MLKKSVPIFALLTLFTTPLMATEPGVLLKADRLSHDQGEDVVRASGNVEMEWAGAHLYAAIASYWREKGLVVAEGGVKLIKSGDTLSGDRAEFYLETQKGAIDKGELFLKQQNIHLGGEKIEKTGEQDYRIKNGTITSCDNPSTGWQFKVADLKLTIDEFATGRNAVLYLADVPAFWLPYIIFPAKTERQSGFLIPTAGNSSKRGVFLEIPYYFAPSPSMDMTFTADLQSKRGAGLAVEHRYLGESKGQGVSHGYLIYDQEQNRFRGDIEIKQQHNFTENTYWRADVSYALDRGYFRDYGTMSGDYNKQYLESLLFLSHKKRDLLFTAGADYLNNLDAPNNGSTLQSIPFTTINGTGAPIPGTPLYYSFSAAATNFDRDSGWRGQRVSLAPTVSLPLHAGPLSGSLQGGYTQRFYSTESSASGNSSDQRGLFNLDAMLQSGFARVYDAKFLDAERIRHTITPQLRYSLTEQKQQADLPFFDYDDRVPGGGILSLSLLNTVTGRSTTPNGIEYRDLARFSVTQGYQASGTRRDLLVLVDEGRRFTDTRFIAELFPFKQWRIFTDDRISPYSGTVTNAAVGSEIGNKSGTSAGLEYRHAEGALDYLSGRVKYADFRPFVLAVEGRYSFDRAAFLETLYSVEYKHQCWSILLSYRDRIDNKEFSFSFNLSGLGNIKLL